MNEKRVERMLRELKVERRVEPAPERREPDDFPVDSWLLWAAVTVVLMATTVVQ